MHCTKLRVYGPPKQAASEMIGGVNSGDVPVSATSKPPLVLFHEMHTFDALVGRPPEEAGWVRDLAYLRELELIAMVTTDFGLSLWDTTCYKIGEDSTTAPRFCHRSHTTQAQSLLVWCPPNVRKAPGRLFL